MSDDGGLEFTAAEHAYLARHPFRSDVAWSAGTRVRSVDGRTGTVTAYDNTSTPYPRLYERPVVRWDDGTRTRVNADTLTRHDGGVG